MLEFVSFDEACFDFVRFWVKWRQFSQQKAFFPHYLAKSFRNKTPCIGNTTLDRHPFKLLRTLKNVIQHPITTRLEVVSHRPLNSNPPTRGCMARVKDITFIISTIISAFDLAIILQKGKSNYLRTKHPQNMSTLTYEHDFSRYSPTT